MPTWSTSRGCARRRGASESPPPSTRRDGARSSADRLGHGPPPSRTRGAAGLLFCGWLASRLGWEPGLAHGGQQRLGQGPRAAPAARTSTLTLEPDRRSDAPGLAGVDDRDAVGRCRSRLTAAPAACAPCGATAKGRERAWTVLGASRGEGGILGEGIRQALLRDPAYRGALDSAEEMLH